MNPDRDFDRLLDQWFADGPTEVANRVVVQVADRIERQSQRPAWLIHWKDAKMTSPARVAAALAAVLVVAIGTYAVIQRAAPGIGGPGSTPSLGPTATPAATYTLTTGPQGTVLHAANFDVPLTLTFGTDWTIAAIDGVLVDLVLKDGTDVGISPLAQVTLPGPALTDPWIPVPADFVAWIGQRPEFTPFAPRTVTIGGRSGTLIDADFVWKDGTPKRDFLRYGSEGGAWLYDQYDKGNRARFVIVPGPSGVGGIVVVMNASGPNFEAAATKLDALLATLQFDAPNPSPTS